MELTRLRVRQFRNIEQAELSFPSRVTVLNGDNAQGKTNVIEAMAVLASLRSFRTRKVADLVMEGTKRAQVQGEVKREGYASTLEVCVDRSGKTATLDGRTPSSAQEYLSSLHVVLFTPWDLELSFGSQEMRRSYVDRAAFLASGGHLALLRRYGRLLRHRNALLRDPASDLSVWNEEMAGAGAAIRRARERVMGDLGAILERVHREVSGGAEHVAFEWERPKEHEESTAAAFLQELESTEEADRRAGHTTTGPHRDSLVLRLGGRDTRAHASRGQHRTAALSLKIAFLLWATQTLGEPPVFLLDDPGSELDARRLSYIGSFLSHWGGQVVVDCTTEANLTFDRGVEPFFYRVREGAIEPWA